MATAEDQLVQPSRTTRVSPKTVKDAITSLLKWKTEKSKTEKPQVLDQDEFVYLIVTLNKIPQTTRTNSHRIRLPHPLISTENESPELCLIIDDRPKSGITKEDAVEKILSEKIPITKVLKLSKLKTKYKAFEAKRKLFDSYEMFFADRRVIPLLPRLIGKKFFVQKKIPLPVDLKHKNWKQQIEKSCGSAMFFIRTGTCSVVKVGKLSMDSDEIVENVMVTLNDVVEILPSKWKYVRSLHLKLSESVSLPIYPSVPELKLKIDDSEEKSQAEKSVVKEEKKKKKKGEKRVVEEEKKKKKKKGERSEVRGKKRKGMIHEVRDMGSNVSEVLADDVIGDVDVRSIESGGVKEKNKKRKKEVSVVDDAEKPKKKVAKGKFKVMRKEQKSGGGLKRKSMNLVSIK